MRALRKASARLAGLVLAGILAGGCSNTTGLNVLGNGLDGSLGTGTGADQLSYKITSVNLSTSNAGSSAQTTRIFVSAGATDKLISESCNTLADSTGTLTAKPCVCRFSWQEVNETSGSIVPITRSAETPVTNVQNSLVECAPPAAYATEIADGTTIQVTVKPSGSNPSQFEAPSYHFTKNGADDGGDSSFQDAEGRSFQNVMRYTCYEKFKRGLDLKNLHYPVQDSSGNTIDYVFANKFCFSKSGDTSATTDCPGLRGTENSAQSYYYNLYVRSNDLSINIENANYHCPMVSPSLVNGDSGNTTTANFWPLDSSFALARKASPEFSVGVEARSKLGLGTDPNSAHSSCYSKTSTPAGNTEIAKSCIGFAAKPSPDGSCPAFKDPSGSTQPTYRLRRFYAVYPPQFGPDGKMIAGAYPMDMIYVLDRPVDAPLADPLKPFTMQGPKPCPFAYFDHRSVATSRSSARQADGSCGASSCVATDANGLCTTQPAEYVGTNNCRWNGVNVDGTMFPNVDDDAGSCSSALPILNSAGTRYSLTTINPRNRYSKYKEIPVRPVTPWSPTYVEDQDFQACAPRSSNFQDPPLHFADDGNAWCAEVYPTHNEYLTDVGPTGAGTSHSDSSGVRERKVQEVSIQWKGFPLLAPAADVEDALKHDKSLACTITYDNGGNKTGKSPPSNGCCVRASSDKHYDQPACGAPAY